MALADVIMRLKIDAAFSAADRMIIDTAIRNGYENSATARAMLETAVTQNKDITINLSAGNFQAVTNSFTADIDLSVLPGLSYIGPDGTAVAYPTDLAILHELGHAMLGLRDSPRDTNTNDDGPNQRHINAIHDELGIAQRLSYEGTAFNLFTDGTNYTNGQMIDVALAAAGSARARDTSANAPGTRDLLFGDDGVNDLRSGAANDFLYGNGGDDQLHGGAGNDFIDGGAGGDVAHYTGACTDYTLTMNANGTFTLVDTRMSSPDGTDTLRDVERAQFTDGQATLDASGLICPGANVMLLVDTSGSMGDDIDAVKASSLAIVDALYGTDAMPVAARLGIITFNDTNSINIVLPFTDQADVAARKTAAINAINALGIDGGGQEPMNEALLTALRGDAGSWNTGSGVNRIVVFSDEPAADPELRPQVLALAANINASVGGLIASNTADGNVQTLVAPDYTPTPLPPVDTSLGIQVLPIAIGGGFSTTNDLRELAEGTGGQVIEAANANEAAAAVLAAVTAPDFTIAANQTALVEGDTGATSVEFTITRDNADAAAELTLSTIGDADAADVTGAPTTVMFAIGQTEAMFTVDVQGDGDAEADETFGVMIDSSDIPATFSVNQASFLIENDDVNVIIGTSVGERLVGTRFDDSIVGRAGDDTLEGLDGNDRLNGEEGADMMIGGAGNDIFTVDNPGDTVVELAGEGRDRINVFTDFTNPENVEFLVGLFSSRGLNLTGSNGRESITGANRINSADVIDASGGNDRVVGLTGDDTIMGGAGNDRIFGNSGFDVITGGTGNDRLTGQFSQDRFVHNPGDNNDRITDFDVTEDLLDLTGHAFNNFGEVQALMSQVAGGALIDLAGPDSVLLEGVAMATIGMEDVLI